MQWRCVYDKGVRLKFPRKNIGTCWKCHQWSIEPILLVHTGCLCNRMVMVRPCKTMQMKNLLAIKGNSPDSGESLVVDPKYNSYRPTWVKHVWLCLFEMFIIQYSCCECLLNGIVPCDMCHCKHAVSCYPLLSRSWVCLWLCIGVRNTQIIRVLRSVLDDRTEEGWDFKSGRVNEKGRHLVWLFIYPVRKWQSSLLSSVGSTGLFVQSML